MAVNDAGQRLSIHAQALGRRAHVRRASMFRRVRPNAGVRDGTARMLGVQPLPCIVSRFNLSHDVLPSVVVVLVADGPHVLAVHAECHAPAVRHPDAPVACPLAMQAMQPVDRR